MKWSSAALAAILFIAWIASGWYSAGAMSSAGYGVSVRNGYVVITRIVGGTRPPIRSTGISGPRPFHMRWLAPTFERANGWYAILPFWALTPVAATAAATAWRLDVLARRRDRLRLCEKCGYDRAGLAAEAKCPECGSAPIVA